ncbi:hypothetical protein ABZS66_44835 [Dactylosporangium sp. NPDC005572]
MPAVAVRFRARGDHGFEELDRHGEPGRSVVEANTTRGKKAHSMADD